MVCAAQVKNRLFDLYWRPVRVPLRHRWSFDQAISTMDDGLVAILPTGSSSSELQELIDQLPSGSTIHLLAGTYVLDRPVTISRDDISLQGAGSDETELLVAPSAA